VGIPAWWASGTNGENRIEARAATQSEAWRQAVEQARGISPNHGCMAIKAALQLRLGPSRRLPLVLVQLAAFLRRKIPHVLQRLLCPRRRVSLPFTVHRL
jgi:hypothetical protein